MGRARVRQLFLRELVLGPPQTARFRVAGTVVELGGARDFPVDWLAFVEVFTGAGYAADYRHASVLDVGAHKGYFGAFAFGSGASAVVSYEPATPNYRALERAASRIAERWSTRHAAVGGERGEGTLFLDRTSWAHSLVRVKKPAGEETVSIVTLADAFEELPPVSRIVAKIDAEGSEYAILAATSVLERVDCLFVEWHAVTAGCTLEELVRVVEASGLEFTGQSGPVLRFQSRPRSEPSQP